MTMNIASFCDCKENMRVKFYEKEIRMYGYI